MNRILLLPLLLLVSAAPATQPATTADERLIVQVRHVEYALKPGEPALMMGDEGSKLPADVTERSSLQVVADVGSPFETEAVINGMSYRLAGKLRKTTGEEKRILVELDYRESSPGEMGKRITQITSNIVANLDQSTQLGGMIGGNTTGSALVLTLKRPTR